MKIRSLILAGLLILTIVGCRPKPIDIVVPQQQRTLVISSACPDGKLVFIGATYSLSALQRLMDSTRETGQINVPVELLVDSGLATIVSETGQTDTLSLVRPGLFVTNHLHLQSGVSYTLHVSDYRNGSKATARALFHPAPTLHEIQPKKKVVDGDTLTVLHLSFDQAQPGAHYALSYTTRASSRRNSQPLPLRLEALHLFQPKQLELFSADISMTSSFTKEITLQVRASDTVMVQVGQVAADYFHYLSTYKRTGSLFNQITGEPINLPSNSSSGLGFFALYQPVVRVFDLNNY